MASLRLLLSCAVSAALLGSSAARAETTCKEPEIGSKQAAMLSPPIASVVTGTGRLQFYSAPDLRCAMNGVFVIPRDELIAYGETDDGWSSVMYTNPRTGNDVSGWVKTARLKRIGTVGPKP